MYGQHMTQQAKFVFIEVHFGGDPAVIKLCGTVKELNPYVI